MSSSLQPPMPPFDAPVQPEVGTIPPRPQSWSAAAIAGFVLSLVGCAVVTGVLGLIFGIVGIFTTSGGRRRGRGLAIAAIPIAIVTSAFGVFSAVSAFKMMDQLNSRKDAVVSVLRSTDNDGKLANLLETHFSDDFRKAVTAEKLSAWLDEIREKHGTLVSAPEQPQPVQGATPLALKYDCKFVNGVAPVIIRFVQSGPLVFLISDVEVDGESPRTAP